MKSTQDLYQWLRAFEKALGIESLLSVELYPDKSFRIWQNTAGQEPLLLFCSDAHEEHHPRIDFNDLPYQDPDYIIACIKGREPSEDGNILDC